MFEGIKEYRRARASSKNRDGGAIVAKPTAVIAGLDPAIHTGRTTFAERNVWMPGVKPGHDEGESVYRMGQTPLAEK
jgi:hypothetical protein